jgi:DNA-binding IclR family transcriptional regulator
MSESSVSRHLNRLVHLGYLHEADRDDNRCHRLLLAWSNPPTTRTP